MRRAGCKRMRVIVTGCAGFIGSHLATSLLADGHDVLGVDNLSRTYDPLLKAHRLTDLRSQSRFRFQEIDFGARGTLDSIFGERPDAVFHLGARAGVRKSLSDPWAYLRDNAEGTLNVLDAARRHDIKKVLLASTSSLYGNDSAAPFREDAAANRPLSPYAASKKAAEAMAASYAHLYGFDLPITRFFTVYGPGGRPDMVIFRFIEWMMRDQPIAVNGDGRQERDFTFVSDIVDGVKLASEKTRGLEVYNFGGNEPTTLVELIGLVEKELGVSAKIERHAMPNADVNSTRADITKARDKLGWDPKISFARGVHTTVAWHKSNRTLLDRVQLGES